jgi:hypothetical protein
MTRALPSPFTAPFDVVVPWVDFADPGYCRAFGRAPPPSPRGFFELRHWLRSLEQHGWWPHIRDVVVLHSDHHPPPSFLRHDHPRLRLVPHTAFAPAAHLPLRSLEEITAHLHAIDGLTPWFLFAEDDGLVLAGVDVFRDFVWRHGRFGVYATSTALGDDDPTASTWERGATEAARVLREAFGPRERRLDLHTPHLLHLPTLQALAARWPQPPAHPRPVFNRIVLHDEYLLDAGLARRYPYDVTRVGARRYTEELHTNGPGFVPPATLRTALRLAVRLHRAERQALFLNVQGPGISAEYDDDGAHAYGAFYDAWLARAFPRPSMFERTSGGR